MRPFRRRLSRAAALWLLALPSPVAAYLTDQAVYPPINEAIFLPPEAGGSYIDPTFGTTITRLSDAPKTPNAARGPVKMRHMIKKNPSEKVRTAPRVRRTFTSV